MNLKTFQDFEEEALGIVDAAKQEGIVLRLMGGIAVWIHCQNASLYERIGRVPGKDIDFASYSKYKSTLTEFLPRRGYTTNTRLMRFPQYAESKRHIYHGEKTDLDIFFDELRMCHTLDWRNRLEIDDPCIPIADVALEKLQIIELNLKDIKDLIILFLKHEIGEVDKNTLNALYITRLLSQDWGFYHTVTTNLNKVKNHVDQDIALRDLERSTLLARIDSLLQRIVNEPKSMSWKMRSRLGTKKKWHQDVAEVLG